MEEGVETDRPAAEQTGRLDAILVRAGIDVVDFRAGDTLSNGDKRDELMEFLRMQVCSLCTVCVADVTWHLLHAGKQDAGPTRQNAGLPGMFAVYGVCGGRDMALVARRKA